MKVIKPIPSATATGMYAKDCSFCNFLANKWQYKVFADIHGGSLEKRRQTTFGGRNRHFSVLSVSISSETLGRCQTRNKVEQLYRSTLLGDKVACLTSQVAKLLISRATNLPDRNHLYSSAISRSVVEL